MKSERQSLSLVETFLDVGEDGLVEIRSIDPEFSKALTKFLPSTIFYPIPYEGHVSEVDGGYDKSGYAISMNVSKNHVDTDCIVELIPRVEIIDDLTSYSENGEILGGQLSVTFARDVPRLGFYQSEDGVFVSCDQPNQEREFISLDKDMATAANQFKDILKGLVRSLIPDNIIGSCQPVLTFK